MDVENMWFKQNGTTCWTAWWTIELLHELFPCCIISHFSVQNWLLKWCNLMPLVCFLWGIRSLMFMTKRPWPDIPQKRKLSVMSTKFSQICPKWFTENFNKRVLMCRQSHESHLFHMLLPYKIILFILPINK